MAKFNVVQKERRARIQKRKRDLHGDPGTGKLKQRAAPVSISGKRKAKLFKKWRRGQKEAIQKGLDRLVTMEDVEMAVAEEGSSQGADKKPQAKFQFQKMSRFKIKKLKGKGKSKKKSAKPSSSEPVDAMVE